MGDGYDGHEEEQLKTDLVTPHILISLMSTNLWNLSRKQAHEILCMCAKNYYEVPCIESAAASMLWVMLVFDEAYAWRHVAPVQATLQNRSSSFSSSFLCRIQVQTRSSQLMDPA